MSRFEIVSEQNHSLRSPEKLAKDKDQKLMVSFTTAESVNGVKLMSSIV